MSHPIFYMSILSVFKTALANHYTFLITNYLLSDIAPMFYLSFLSVFITVAVNALM